MLKSSSPVPGAKTPSKRTAFFIQALTIVSKNSVSIESIKVKQRTDIVHFILFSFSLFHNTVLFRFCSDKALKINKEIKGYNESNRQRKQNQNNASRVTVLHGLGHSARRAGRFSMILQPGINI